MDKRLKKGIVYLTFSVFLILILPFLLTRSNFLGFDFSTTGQIGDTIGGIVGPFIAIIAAILTFLAFWIQYEANQIQIKNFTGQRDDIQKERFETLLFEMLKIHRENLTEIEIVGHNDKIAKGRETIQYMYNELKRTYLSLISFCNLKETEFTPEEKERYSVVAYLIFFFGIREHDYQNEYLKSILSKYLKMDEIKEIIKKFIEQKSDDDMEENNPEIISPKDRKTQVFYTHNEGHIHQLGHYFRHLYQLFKFIDSFPDRLLGAEEKEKYARIVRSQLSNYEQLLIYYNSLSHFGNSWSKNRYIQKYRVIKNIPLPLTFGYKPEEKYSDAIIEYREMGKKFFEWLE